MSSGQGTVSTSAQSNHSQRVTATTLSDLQQQNPNIPYQEKLAKLKQKKIAEFEHNVTNMLIHLYNGKQCQDYIKEYKTIVDNVILLIFLCLFL
jgi:thiaminase